MAEHPPVTKGEAKALTACILGCEPEEIDHFVIFAARSCNNEKRLHPHVMSFCDSDTQALLLISASIDMFQ